MTAVGGGASLDFCDDPMNIDDSCAFKLAFQLNMLDGVGNARRQSVAALA
jgi:hypothetical protein